MKKKIFVICIAAVILAIAVGSSLAYFVSSEKAHNVITTGNVNIKLIEKTYSSDGKLIDFPKEGIDNVLPGSTVDKIVYVENTGSATVWIRLKVYARITKGGEELPTTLGDDNIPAITFTPSEDWVEKDGYYYYTKPVSSKGTTDHFIDKVFFSTKIDNNYQQCNANLIVQAEAVQVANNGNTVLDATGWPEA